MKNKKIFFVADAKSIHTAKWIDYFVEQKYDVYMATFASVNNTKCNSIFFLGNKKTVNSGGNYHYIFSVKKLAQILKEVSPDIINAHYSYSMGLITLLARRYANLNSSFSVVCHGSDVLAPPNKYIFDKVNRYIFKNCDKIFVVSDQIKDKVESLGITLDKVFVGQYGINTKQIKRDKNIDILSNRAYNTNSRIDFLLECIEEMSSSKLNIVFILPNIQKCDFNTLVAKYPSIQFYEHIEYSKMLDLISRTKVYISATKSDGTSLSLLEALNAQCIPVVSNIVSNRSWILNTINGYLYDTKEDFIKKLNDALDMDEKNRDQIHANNTKLLNSNANYITQMKKIEYFLMGKKV